MLTFAFVVLYILHLDGVVSSILWATRKDI